MFQRNRQNEDRIVAVMGPTGAGKSTFIEYATRQNGGTVGHGLRSSTNGIRAVRTNHPKDSRPVVFVDTPGFDDTYKSDLEILTMITDWLVKTYKSKSNLTTIIYMHSIVDYRMTASALKNLRIFATLCGQKAMPNVIIVTTKWSKIAIEEGARRMKELETHFWKDMIVDGCGTARFEDTYESAWNIIGSLGDKHPVHVQLAHEIVDSKLLLNETHAGIAIDEDPKEWVKSRQETDRRLREPARNQVNELVVQQNAEADRFVVVMGPTGAGKSTFIEYATRQSTGTVGHGLQSYTTDIRTVRVNHPKDGCPVVLVDTPGFDNTHKSDLEILTMIADWLVKTYKNKSNITTIIYVHDISDSRMAGSALKDLRVFRTVCGKKAMPNVIMVTTKWNMVTIEGVRRQQELETSFWKDMIADGCGTAHFKDTYESAWSIIGSLGDKHRVHVQLAREIVDFKLPLDETHAGIAIDENSKELIKGRKETFRSLWKLVWNLVNKLVVQQNAEADRFVVVMGPTGAGKGTFIEHATRQDSGTIGHGLQSYTSDIRFVRVNHPIDKRPVVFVDTPGFDDTYQSDLEILTMIAEWLVKINKSKSNLITIIYIHCIADSRMKGSALKNLQMFGTVLGNKAMPNVIMVTTKWSKVTKEGVEREQELKAHFWKDMIADGCRIARFEDSYDSAWSIIGSLRSEHTAQVQLPREMVDSKHRLNETQAGIALNKDLEQLIKNRKEMARRVWGLARNQDNEPAVRENSPNFAPAS